MNITVTNDVTMKQLLNLLVGAWEGGSNYWYLVKDQILADGVSLEDIKPEPQGRCHKEVAGEGEYYPRYMVVPFIPGCSLVITSLEDDEVNGKKEWLLNLDTLAAGIQIMATKYPRHFADFKNEDDDAETADVFLQVCLFGEIIYG